MNIIDEITQKYQLSIEDYQKLIGYVSQKETKKNLAEELFSEYQTAVLKHTNNRQYKKIENEFLNSPQVKRINNNSDFIEISKFDVSEFKYVENVAAFSLAVLKNKEITEMYVLQKSLLNFLEDQANVGTLFKSTLDDFVEYMSNIYYSLQKNEVPFLNEGPLCLMEKDDRTKLVLCVLNKLKGYRNTAPEVIRLSKTKENGR